MKTNSTGDFFYILQGLLPICALSYNVVKIHTHGFSYLPHACMIVVPPASAVSGGLLRTSFSEIAL